MTRHTWRNRRANAQALARLYLTQQSVWRIVPCLTLRPSQRTAARCGGSSASTRVLVAASIRSSACASRTRVPRTYREVVMMLA